MIDHSEPVHSFMIKDDENSSLIMTILMHHGMFMGTIVMIFAV